MFKKQKKYILVYVYIASKIWIEIQNKDSEEGIKFFNNMENTMEKQIKMLEENTFIL
jgi:hypothetical protein